MNQPTPDEMAQYIHAAKLLVLGLGSVFGAVCFGMLFNHINRTTTKKGRN